MSRGGLVPWILLALLWAPPHLQAHPVDRSFTPESTYTQLKPQYPSIELAEVAPAPGVRIERNRVYRDDLNRPLHVDVFLPANKTSRPGVLLVHGGGWKSGSRRHQEPMATYLANRGLVAVTVEYRLSPEAGYPAGMEDLVQALGWMRRHAAELGLDAGRIAVLGCSSGAQMATLLGVAAGGDLPLSWSPSSAPVQAIVNIDGIVSFTTPLALSYENDPAKRPSAAEAWFGGRFEEVPALWQEASPLTYADADSPPTLFINSALTRFHAGRDAYIRRLAAGGVTTRVHTLADTPHPFWLFDPWFKPAAQQVQTFLQEVLAGE